jgi:hypothetical protein
MLVDVAVAALTVRVSSWVDGPVVAEPSQLPPGGVESVPLTRNVYVPVGVDNDVETLSVDVAEFDVVVTGFVPKVAVAPVGRATEVLSVVLHGLVFPTAETVTRPKFAV